MSPIFRIRLKAPKSGNTFYRRNKKGRIRDHKKAVSFAGWAGEILAAFQEIGLHLTDIPRQGESLRYLVFYLFSSQLQDDNNFHIAIKPIVDLFQEGRVVDAVKEDSIDWCRVFYVPIKSKKRHMTVELWEQEQFLQRFYSDQSFAACFLTASPSAIKRALEVPGDRL